MKIKKIYVIPAWYCNNYKDHSNDSDPVKIWMWDKPKYDEQTEEITYDDYDDYGYDEDEENSNPYNRNTFSTEITIISDKSKEIFLIEETVSDNNKNEFLLKHFAKNINSCTAKELNYFKEIFELSIDFAKEYMKELIYDGQENVDDEDQIKSFLEQYLWHINYQIKNEEERIKNALKNYDL